MFGWYPLEAYHLQEINEGGVKECRAGKGGETGNCFQDVMYKREKEKKEMIDVTVAKTQWTMNYF